MEVEEFYSVLEKMDFADKYYEIYEKYKDTELVYPGGAKISVFFDALEEEGVQVRNRSSLLKLAIDPETIAGSEWSGFCRKNRQGTVEISINGAVSGNFSRMYFAIRRRSDSNFGDLRFKGVIPYPRLSSGNNAKVLREIAKDYLILLREIKDAIRNQIT